jgi:hypothetical protein
MWRRGKLAAFARGFRLRLNFGVTSRRAKEVKEEVGNLCESIFSPEVFGR